MSPGSPHFGTGWLLVGTHGDGTASTPPPAPTDGSGPVGWVTPSGDNGRMTTFSANKTSQATVDFPRDLVWGVLTDPDTVARLTPMVESISSEADRWRWQLTRIPVLGRTFELAFTEAMTYDEPSRITFQHTPDGDERAGTDGRYDLGELNGGRATDLRIDLTVTVDLPFPGLARPAVQAAMHGVLTAMGAGFARSIDKELRTRAARRP